ncbi:NUDIX domain-containing protein [Kaistia geumhonensis]|uniref:NUDIX family NTP pyrophosphohydrolase n=1 Tax=Kaistia geumhonensis TaxID=410839 RepID=A0ABU0M1L6_9HYPH|nr:NUDIX domain-containing protein [Kaistia geumhonensis]MCX5479940.1 NUDIX domain-containing protein [Kaistia geumhonensis]MDQ0514832.1 putative NUDIX family NTP pyrophosphohydrolase [Kaistia geumhonensis]
MAKTAESAGILMYRKRERGIEVLLVHPGGPFWRNRDAGAWTIPKGEIEPGESIDYAARREFAEELGVVPTGALLSLGSVRQKAGKIVHGFAMEGDFELARFVSNLFEMEWPPRSGRIVSFPEVDRAEWQSIVAAREKINPAQILFLDRLVELAAR